MRNLFGWIISGILGIVVVLGLGYFTGVLDGFFVPDDVATDVPSLSDSVDSSVSSETSESPDSSDSSDSSILSDAADSTDRDLPYFDLVRVEPDGSIVVSGRSHIGSRVELLTGDGSVIGDSDTATNGDFVIVPSPLSPGDYTLVLRSVTDGSGILSTEVATVKVPALGDGEVIVLVSREGEASRIISGLSPDPVVESVTESDSATDTAATDTDTTTDTATDTTTDTDVSPIDAPVVFAVEAVEYEDGEIFVAGSVGSGAAVRVYIDNESLGLARGTSDDRFLLSSTYDLSSGRHTVRADMINESDGSVISRVEVPFVHQPVGVGSVTSETLADSSSSDSVEVEGSVASTSTDISSTDTSSSELLRTGTTMIIKWGDTLWDISRKQYGRGIRYTTIYRVNRDQIQDPDLIYVGQIFRIPDKPDPDPDIDELQ